MAISPISPISSNNSPDPLQTDNLSRIKNDFKALTSAIKSGDLNAAKTAYASILADTGIQPPANSPLAAIGTALQTGDLKTAQQVLSAIPQGHHGHGHKKAQATDLTALLLNATATTTTSATASVQTNLSTGKNADGSYSA